MTRRRQACPRFGGDVSGVSMVKKARGEKVGLSGPFLVSDAADNVLRDNEIWNEMWKSKRPRRAVKRGGLKRHWR